MGLIITPESDLGRELAKWDKPYRYEPYPRMLYKAVKRSNGKVMCGDPEDESFSRSCQRIVQNEAEQAKAEGEGWRETPDQALAHHEALERAIADAAAEVNFRAVRLSEKAQAELAAANEATHEHVTDVTGKRGPKGKRVELES